jgi:hypothetical protein
MIPDCLLFRLFVRAPWVVLELSPAISMAWAGEPAKSMGTGARCIRDPLPPCRQRSEPHPGCLDPSWPSTTPCASPAGTLRFRFSLIRSAFAVRERLGDPRNLPYFCGCAFCACCRPYPGGPPCPPVVLTRRFQASSNYQGVATRNARLCQQYPTGLFDFGAASFALCYDLHVCLALLTGYDGMKSRALHRAF